MFDNLLPMMGSAVTVSGASAQSPMLRQPFLRNPGHVPGGFVRDQAWQLIVS
jgi:hypothetical protein